MYLFGSVHKFEEKHDHDQEFVMDVYHHINDTYVEIIAHDTRFTRMELQSHAENSRETNAE